MVSLEFFHWHNPSDRTMALGSTQPLTEMNTRSISWGGKSGRCVRLTTLPTSWAIVTKSGNLNFLESSGPLQACNGDWFLNDGVGQCWGKATRVAMWRLALSRAAYPWHYVLWQCCQLWECEGQLLFATGGTMFVLTDSSNIENTHNGWQLIYSENKSKLIYVIVTIKVSAA